MNPLTKIFMLVDRRHDVRMKIAWERGRELDSLHAGRRHRAQQTTERGSALKPFQTAFGFGSIAIYVLTDEMNFLIAVAPQLV